MGWPDHLAIRFYALSSILKNSDQQTNENESNE